MKIDINAAGNEMGFTSMEHKYRKETAALNKLNVIVWAELFLAENVKLRTDEMWTLKMELGIFKGCRKVLHQL